MPNSRVHQNDYLNGLKARNYSWSESNELRKEHDIHNPRDEALEYTV